MTAQITTVHENREHYHASHVAIVGLKVRRQNCLLVSLSA